MLSMHELGVMPGNLARQGKRAYIFLLNHESTPSLLVMA